ncbi:MAG: glycosyltransferase family 4 protein [Salinivirgaceae bacterium]|nr:glycosyltransferase family 4 protein [Salinivirgaceae bacterium]
MANKPKILFIVPLPPPIHGSAMVSQQIKDSKLIGDTFCCDWVNFSTSRSMNEIGQRNPIKIWRFISALFITFWKLLTRRYAFCYLGLTCHGSGFLKDTPFALLCKLFRRKIVIHQHNKGMSADVDKWPYHWLLPLVYRNAKVILLSWHLYLDIERVVKKEQVMICPNGIPQTNSETIIRNNKVPHLLFLSNLIITKGVHVLLDACKILKDKGQEFVCDFVGAESKEISEWGFKNEVSCRGLEGIVQYHGRKYGAEKTRFFTDSDIFIHPTYNDCFPLVLLEAMQYQLPIVTTNEGGIPDVVQDGVNGFICERQNAESLAAAIERLLLNPSLRCQMGNTGYEIYRQNFTLEKFESRMRECLSAVLTT